MFKLKVKGVREEVEKLIKDAGEHFKLYDPRFPDEDQCSGYHVFKELCLMKEQPCTIEEFEHYKNMEDVNKLFSGAKCPNGFYLITQLHPNARKKVLSGVNQIRGVFQRGEARITKIAKK